MAATGEVTRVTVTIQGMRFTPDTLRVPAGNSLQITVVNSGDDVHDLVLETGERTPRLSPGQSATLEIPVVGRDLAGWCSIAGHRQMGMVLAIEVDGVSDTTAGLGHLRGALRARRTHRQRRREHGIQQTTPVRTSWLSPVPGSAPTTHAWRRHPPAAPTGSAWS